MENKKSYRTKFIKSADDYLISYEKASNLCSALIICAGRLATDFRNSEYTSVEIEEVTEYKNSKGINPEK